MTRLYYFGARFQDPELGMWISGDPAEQYSNPYSFTGGDPFNQVDPNGMYSWTKFLRQTGNVAKGAGNAVADASKYAVDNPLKATGYLTAFAATSALAVVAGPVLIGAAGVLAGNALAGAVIGSAVTGALTGAFGVGANYAANGFAGNGWDASQLGTQMLMGAALGAVTGAALGGASYGLSSGFREGVQQDIANFQINHPSLTQNLVGIREWASSNLKFKLTASTDMYRAVMPTELNDVQSTGTFRNLGDAEGKYFTTSPENATSYGKQAYFAFKDPAYTLVKTRVPNWILSDLSPADVDGGIPAFVIPDSFLPDLKPEILPSMPILR